MNNVSVAANIPAITYSTEATGTSSSSKPKESDAKSTVNASSSLLPAPLQQLTVSRKTTMADTLAISLVTMLVGLWLGRSFSVQSRR